jgi:hypothetical protein
LIYGGNFRITFDVKTIEIHIPGKPLIMRKSFALITIIIPAIVIIVSCSKGDSVPPATIDCSAVTSKTFAADVNPIIQTFCNQASCHDVASTNGPGPLTNYTQVFSARTAIRGQITAGLMPQNTTLTAAQKNSIICWIDNGAPDN